MCRWAWRLLPVLCVLLAGTAYGDEWSDLVVSPRSLDFGEVVLGEQAEREVEIRNTGRKKVDLDDLEIRLSRGLWYFQAEEDCPEELKSDASCNVRLRFTPLAVGEQQGEMRITLDDDLLAEIPLTASAVRESTPPLPEEPTPADPDPSQPPPAPADPPPVPTEPVLPGRMLLLDTVYPPDVGEVDFGTVPVGLARRQIVTVFNEGPGALVLGVIPGGPIDPFFEVRALAENRSHCSEKVLYRNQECSIVVAFRPGEEGAMYQAELTIPYADAGQPVMETARVRLRGSGGAATDDYPAPALIHPDPGQNNLKSSVQFRWSLCSDAEGRPASYRLYCSQDPAFVDTVPRRVGSLALAGIGAGALLLARVRSRRRRRTLALATVLFLAAALLACSEDIEESAIGRASGLESGATYHWQVVAEYEEGIEATSETRTFSVR